MLAGNFNFGGLNPIYDPATHGVRAECAVPAGGKRLLVPDCRSRTTRFRSRVSIRRFAIFLGRNPYTPENNTQRAFNARFGTDEQSDHADQLPVLSNALRRQDRSAVFAESQDVRTLLSCAAPLLARPLVAGDRVALNTTGAPCRFRSISATSVISDTYTISPTMINEIASRIQPPAGNGFPEHDRSGLGQATRHSERESANVPEFPGCNNQSNCTGGTTFFRQDNSGLSASQEVGEDFTFQENLTKVFNRHTLKFGYEMIRTRYNSLVPALPSGIVPFRRAPIFRSGRTPEIRSRHFCSAR